VQKSLSSSSIEPIATTRPDLFAFRIVGEVSAGDMDAMAKFMNAAFDRHDKVDMLLVFERFDGSEVGSMFDMDVIKAQWRSLAKVGKYVVVGAPDAAGTMIETMGTVLPIETRTFDKSELQQAWTYLGAAPSEQGAA